MAGSQALTVIKTMNGLEVTAHTNPFVEQRSLQVRDILVQVRLVVTRICQVTRKVAQPLLLVVVHLKQGAMVRSNNNMRTSPMTKA